jgi:hypothetical protein
MQLPRGTFREIIKNRPLGSIIENLERTDFSGVCSIPAAAVAGTLVFKNGRFILAKIHGKAGDAAIHELPPLGNLHVDAALATLDTPQIQLALEFNKQFLIKKADRVLVDTTRNQGPAEKHPQVSHTPDKKPDPSTFVAVPDSRYVVIRKPAFSGIPRPGEQHSKNRKIVTEIPVQDTGDPDSFENDISTLEAMNLDTTTEKMRRDCKTLVQQLDLEHLMKR